MGLLDELEQQAQRRKASADDAEKRKAEREEIYRTRIEPGMTALYEYLQKLAASLKVLKPKTRQSYALPGYGEVVGYIDHDYDLQISTQTSSREIKLAFPCLVASDECPTIEVQGGSGIKAVAGIFQRYHLGGLSEPKKDPGGEVVSGWFKAKGKVMLSATFVGDAESATVRMTFANFEGLGNVTKTVAGTQLDDALFDEIGRFVTREPNNLLREELPDAYRMQLRTKVQRDQTRRRWENTINERQQTELAQIRRDRSITGRLAKLLAKSAKGDKDGKAVEPGSRSAITASRSWLGRLKGLVKKQT